MSVTWNPDTIPTPLLRLYAQTYARYRQQGLTVAQALREARVDVLEGRAA